MKKQSNLLLTAALVCGLSLGIASCKSDEDNDRGRLKETEFALGDLVTHGIETDMQSAIIELPVKANGEWTATLTEDVNWCQILDWQVSYTGNQTLILAVDENLTKSGRSCELILGSGLNKYTRIKVYQAYNYNGEDPTNGSGQAFADKGVGTGIDYNYLFNVKSKENVDPKKQKFDPTMVHGANNIFNIRRIEELQTSGELERAAYVEAEIPIADLKAELVDSCVVQCKTIDASLELSVNFGIIEFSAKAGYTSTKMEGKAHIDYTILRVAPMYNVYLAPAILSTYAKDYGQKDKRVAAAYMKRINERIETYKEENEYAMELGDELVLNKQGLTAEQTDEIRRMRKAIPYRSDFGGIFSSAFALTYNNLYKEIVLAKENGDDVDNEEVKRLLKKLDNEFGPFYIAGGNFGGVLAMHARVDTLRQEGTAKFMGEIGASGAGLFSVSGHFEYTDSGYNVLHNIQPTIYIVGGDANGVADKMNEIILSGRPNDFSKWKDVLSDWFTSMRSPIDPNATNLSQAAPISFIIKPIWDLFAEPEIQQTVKKFFMEEYADRGIEGYEKIISGGITPGADQLLNSDSDFWKKYLKK